MKSNSKSMGAIRWLLLLSDNNNVTLICFCKDESKCHRSIVRDLALKEDRLCVKKAQNANVIMDD